MIFFHVVSMLCAHLQTVFEPIDKKLHHLITLTCVHMRLRFEATGLNYAYLCIEHCGVTSAAEGCEEEISELCRVSKRDEFI